MSEISDTDKSDKNESADAEMAATVEAILFSTDAPITVAKILQVGELTDRKFDSA